MLNDVFIYDSIRTPRGRGKSTGSLYEVTPVRLAAGLFRQLQQRNNLDTRAVDCVLMGIVSPVGEQGAVLPKAAVYMADWAESVPAVQLNTFCASGLVATNNGAMQIASGSEQLVVSGGIECMSRVRMGSDGGALFLDPEVVLKHKSVPQGIGADLIATMEGFSRQDVDAYALRSQQRAAAAWKEGRFAKSIVPVCDANGLVILDRDEYIRADTTAEALAALNPSFEMVGSMGADDLALSRYPDVESINHVHTPGNASGIVDGAALILMGSAAAGKTHKLKPRARVVASTLLSTDPTIMLVGPTPATRKVLKKAGLSIDQIDLFEVNEAFAVVPMKFMKDLGVSADRVNVNGGAIAMGHPLGATGAVILGTLLDELERRGLRYGLATLCAGGGMGVATIIERVV